MSEPTARDENISRGVGNYVVISPCRDEARYMRHTLDSMISQTVRPALWVIVDDGSTDDTPTILAEYAARHDWIQVIRREDRGKRAVGPGVIEAFYAGLETVDLDQFDYVCKLDLDLEIPGRYFQRVIEGMQNDDRLGNFSGKLFLQRDDARLDHERTGNENAVGPAKFYRTACFKEIGGFVHEVSWDGIDGHMCRIHGWVARSADGPDLRIIHLRQMGSSHKNIWTGRLRWGKGKWFMGSAWYYVLALSVYRALEPPYVLGGLGIFTGYVRAALTGTPRFPDLAFRRHLRRYELRSLFLGKQRATDLAHEQIRANAGGYKAR